MSTHQERCERESTQDVIFLLQSVNRSMESAGVFAYWKVESVWLDRDEAEAFAKATEYRYPRGWRVYGVPSEGRLARLLQSQDGEPTR